MKVVRLARLLPALLLVLTPFLEGCGDFWQAPSGGGGGGGTPTTDSSGYFYVINQTAMQVVPYYINSGTLTNVGSPLQLNAAPTAIAIASGNGFLYVSTVAGIFLYTINSSTGELSAGNNGNAISGDLALAMAVDTTGNWLLDAVPVSGGVIVNAIPITSSGATNGTTEQQRSYALTNAAVEGMALSGDDSYIFLAAGPGGTLVIPYAGSTTNSNGNPLPTTANVISTVTSGASSFSVAVDPGASPRLFYVGETEITSTSGGLRAFDYSSLGTSKLVEIAGSPYTSTGLAPHAILPEIAGKYVYVASWTGASSAGDLEGFNITSNTSGSTTTYTLSSINSIATGIEPDGLAEDSTGNFVLAVSAGGNSDLEAYTFSTTTNGELVDNINSTTGTDPTGAVAVAAQTQ